MAHAVFVAKVVEKYLKKIAPADEGRIRSVIDRLADDPRPDGCKKLRRDMGYGVRAGDYRVIYRVDDGEQVVRVYRVGDRKDVYR